MNYNIYFKDYLNTLTLSKRKVAEEAITQYMHSLSKEVKSIKNAEEAYKHLQYLSLSDVEEAVAIYLNKQHKILATITLSKGSIDGVQMDMKEILRNALLLRASGIILSHNHTSGSLIPSTQDKDITKNFVSACKVFNIRPVDHIIITQNNYYSFTENGQL